VPAPETVVTPKPVMPSEGKSPSLMAKLRQTVDALNTVPTMQSEKQKLDEKVKGILGGILVILVIAGFNALTKEATVPTAPVTVMPAPTSLTKDMLQREQEAQSKAEAELRPGKVFKDCTACPEMVVVPAGTFEMGSNSGEVVEQPVHTVRIGNPFALGKTEVTHRQWRSVMGSDPFVDHGNSGAYVPEQPCDDCPVTNVSWNNVQEYVQKLSQKAGKIYRLPSEAEWEYACRAGGTHTYCGGDSIDSVAWTWVVGNSDDKAHPVAKKQANAWGLYDMSGNAWEWTDDCWNESYINAPSDGSAWTKKSCTFHVVRGGSWTEESRMSRSSARTKIALPDRGRVFGDTGFRVATTAMVVTPPKDGAALVTPPSRSVAPDEYAEYVNSRFGFSIRYPSKLLVPRGESGNGDGQGFISQDKQTKLSAYGSHTLLGGTLKDDFEKELQANPNSQITYRVLRNNWYVISGTDRGLIFYRKTVQVRDGYATFNFSFPIEHRGTWDKVLVEIAKGFNAKE
jgi:formylglycine-generating enzyme required for sulfatase activity